MALSIGIHRAQQRCHRCLPADRVWPSDSAPITTRKTGSLRHAWGVLLGVLFFGSVWADMPPWA